MDVIAVSPCVECWHCRVVGSGVDGWRWRGGRLDASNVELMLNKRSIDIDVLVTEQVAARNGVVGGAA